MSDKAVAGAASVLIGRNAALKDFVTSRVGALQAGYLAGGAGATASLARLRRAFSDQPGANPSVWEETLGLPDTLRGRSDEPSRAERAVHYALTLYAVHQQARGGSMHRQGYGLGRSARLLGKAGTASEDAVLRRFQAMGTSGSIAEAATHARGLITQFRAAEIPLDYGQLAADFFRFQDPRQSGSVRLTWGRDFYRVRASDSVDYEAAESSESGEGEVE